MWPHPTARGFLALDRPADQVRDDGQRQCPGQIRDAVNMLARHGGGHGLTGQLLDATTHRAQRPRQQAVRDQLTSLIMFVAVTIEYGAAGQPIHDGV